MMNVFVLFCCLTDFWEVLEVIGVFPFDSDLMFSVQVLNDELCDVLAGIFFGSSMADTGIIVTS